MKPKENRVEQMNIRMTPMERAKVEAAALIHGVTFSEWARAVMLAAASIRKEAKR